MLFTTAWAGSSRADSLSDAQQQLAEKQKQAQQLQSQMSQTSQQIQSQQQKTKALQQQLTQTQQLLGQTQHQIADNQNQQQQLQGKIDQLTKEIESTQAELLQDKSAMDQMLRASYEDGTVPYLYVIFQSANFSDLIGRLNLLGTVVKTQKALLDRVTALDKQLNSEHAAQNEALHQLQSKGVQLYSMKQSEVALQNQKQTSITLVNRSISVLQQQEQQFSQEMHLTQQQMNDLKQQIAEQEAIQATQSGNIVEADLRYRDVSAQKLYNYVHAHGSIFTLSDIQTICQAAQNYNVNPILLVAITGQEEDFVQASWSSAPVIRKNPFNVYYSWMWTTQYRPSWGLLDSANIAANTVRHKLSVPPPFGEDVFNWLNDPKNPWGLYATDRAWSAGVRWFYNDITRYVGSGL